MPPFSTDHHELGVPQVPPSARGAAQHDEPGASQPRLAVNGLSKTFGRSQVLRRLSLSVRPGEIHSLVGHNGSGKSTFVKVLAGFHAPDPGCAIILDGTPLRVPLRSRDLASAGISFVHQDLGLIDSLSVTENCQVGRFATRRLSRRIDWKGEHELVRSVLARLDSDLDPRAPVGALPAADRATVAIARAVAGQRPGRGVIVLDEATRALPRPAQEHLYQLIEAIAADGGSVILITHRVGEVLRLADRVSVLRDGELIANGVPTASLDPARLGQLLTGHRDSDQAGPRTGAPAGSPAGLTAAAVTRSPAGLPAAAVVRSPAGLPAAAVARSPAGLPAVAVARFPGAAPDVREAWARIDGLAGEALAGVSFEVKPGEVLGITGLIGSGADELPGLLTGARRAAAGRLTVPGGTIDLSRPALRHCLDAGVVLVPERRDTDGLALDLSVRENLALPMVRRRSRPWKVPGRWEDELTRRSVADLGIVTAGGPEAVSAQPVGLLSGGNRQKVLLGKWLATGPRLLVLHEPTQGVDVGARAQLLALIRQAAAAGVAVVMSSIEAEDLAAVCDRVLVLRGGLIYAERPGPCEPEEIVQLTYQEAS